MLRGFTRRTQCGPSARKGSPGRPPGLQTTWYRCQTAAEDDAGHETRHGRDEEDLVEPGHDQHRPTTRRGGSHMYLTAHDPVQSARMALTARDRQVRHTGAGCRVRGTPDVTAVVAVHASRRRQVAVSQGNPVVAVMVSHCRESVEPELLGEALVAVAVFAGLVDSLPQDPRLRVVGTEDVVGSVAVHTHCPRLRVGRQGCPVHSRLVLLRRLLVAPEAGLGALPRRRRRHLEKCPRIYRAVGMSRAGTVALLRVLRALALDDGLRVLILGLQRHCLVVANGTGLGPGELRGGGCFQGRAHGRQSQDKARRDSDDQHAAKQ